MRSLTLLVAFSCILFGRPAIAAPPSPQPEALLLELIPRRELPVSQMGVNAFANDPRFGSVRSQLREVKRVLKLKYLRVLFAWNDQVQPTPTSPINFSFYDDIVRNIPDGAEAFAVLTGVPSWMHDPNNWLNGNSGYTFAERWVRAVTQRYRKKSKLNGFQIWNEPNDDGNPDNIALGLAADPAKYVELLAWSAAAVKQTTPKKKVICGATTAINQNFPETLDYNREMKALGAEAFADIWAMHFYGSHWENVIVPGTAADFLNGLSLPIWVTESGKQGVIGQREYAERTWPFLRLLVPKIRRFYHYQFTDSTPADSTYGLKNLTPGFTVSDLYIYLRDRRRR